MSDQLQDALDRKYFWRAEQDIMEVPTYSFDLLVDAARKVANPDYEAAVEAWDTARFLSDPEAIVTMIVNAALGIDSEDTDGS